MNKMVCKIRNKQAIRQTGIFLAVSLTLVCLISALFITTAHVVGSGQVTLTIHQVFTGDGSSTPPNTAFTYRLTPKDASSPMPAGSGSDGYAFTITGTEETQIGPINYSDVGIYVYELYCVTVRDSGYTVDQQVYTITVYVTNDMTPISIVYLSNGNKASEISFEHIYGTLPSDPDTMVDPPVTKTVNGNPKIANSFLFKLTAEDPSYPMPTGSENGVKILQITGEGEAEFGTWSYTKEGIYRYTVSEVNTGIISYAYDTTVYTITDDVKAANGRLVVTRTVTNNESRKAASFVFINTYMGKPGKPGIGPLTGDFSNPIFWVALIVISSMLFTFIIWLLYRKPNRSNKQSRNRDLSESNCKASDTHTDFH